MAEPFAFDISKEEDDKSMIEYAVKKWGKIDGLYNVAAALSKAVLGRDNGLMDLPDDVIQKTFGVNTIGVLYACRHAVKAMLETGGGTIINMISSAGTTIPNMLAYGMSKNANVVLTKNIAQQFGKKGIRCMAIDPGVTRTDNCLEMNTEEVINWCLESARNTRLGEPEDIAAAVAFLFSDECKWNQRKDLCNQQYGQQL